MTKILVFDTETTADEIQRFKFGFYRYGEWDGTDFTCEVEGLFYDDEFATDAEYNILRLRVEHYTGTSSKSLASRDHFRRLPSGLTYAASDTLAHGFEFTTLETFREECLWKRVYKGRAHLVGFNLPFDISRVACNVAEARHPRFKGGFSYIMWNVKDGTRENTYRPRLLVRMLDSRKSFIEFGSSNRNVGGNSGTFLDLRTLAFSLTNAGHSLASACATFSVPHGKLEVEEHGKITPDYVDYARRDVQATSELYVHTMQEFQRHPIKLRPSKAYSPASMSKAYFRAMGIPEPLERADISDEILGYCMTAFYGARSECRIRRLPVPVALVDFTSMYPTVNALLNNWDFLTGEKIYAQDSTRDVRQMLADITLEDCFNQSTWRRFRGIAKVHAAHDVLPVRSRYGKNGWNIGINYYSGNGAQWYAIPDLIASKIITGKSPVIERAITFESSGRVAGLRETRFAGRVPFTPDTDFFSFVVDERSKYTKQDRANEFLKVLANAGCYGIFAEINREETTHDSDLWLFGDETWLSTSRRIETPGAYSFPPISTVITASARLMLAMLERCVTDYNGGWAFTDTDSMAIVADNASEVLGDFRVLSYAEVDSIRDRFASLNPYSRIKDILKIEYKGMCYAISSKRYCLYQTDSAAPDGIRIDKYSSHGLGHLISPTIMDESGNNDWVADIWRHILSGSTAPAWFNKPALSRYAVTQMSLLRSFGKFNHGRTFPEGIKPSNFILIGHGSKFQPTVTGRIVPIRSFERDSSKWLDKPWINKYDDKPVTVGVYGEDDMVEQNMYYLKSYGDVVNEYALHPEEKFSTIDGTPCYPSYVGRLERLHIRSLGNVYLGKESHQIEPVQLGLISVSEAQTVYHMTGEHWSRLHPLIKSCLNHLTNAEIGKSSGIATNTVVKIMQGRTPSDTHLRKITRLACLIACDELGHSYTDGDDPVRILTEWTDHRYSPRNVEE